MPYLENFTVNHLMELRGFREAHLLSGKDGLERLVTGMTVVDAPDGADHWAEEGKLVMTTLFIFKEVQAQDRLVRHLIEKKAAGLGIKFGRFVNELSPEILAYADSQGFPILGFYNDCTWADLINSVIEEAIRQGQDLSLESSEHYRSFFKKALRGQNLRALLDKLYDSLDKPITVIDLEQSLTLSCPDEPLDEERKAHASALLEAAPAYADHQTRTVSDGQNKFLMEQVTFEDQLLGYVIVWDTDHLPADKTIFLDQTLMALSVLLFKNREVKRVLARFKDDLVSTLITKGTAMQYNPRKRARDLNWILGTFTSVLLVQSVPIGRSESLCWEELKKLMNLVRDFRRKKNLTTVPVGFDSKNNIALILSDDEQVLPCEPYPMALSLLSYLCDREKTLFHNIGIGTRKEGIEGIPESYQEARTALAVALTSDGSHVLNYKNIGVFRLLYQVASTPAAREFLKEHLQPIKDLDDKHDSELLHSLNVFLKQNRNFRAAAKALHIHYNTVRYRMELIEKKCGLDLNNADTVLNLQIALQLEKIIDS